MFAKPTKKPNTAAPKGKQGSKNKTVSVKSGLKVQQSKRPKPDGKTVKTKPAVRQDAGYSLYSTDSEDQVATAFTEMETCEKILTHLKSKQKEKTKGKKKKDTSPQPKALNDGPPLSQVPTTIDYRLPYSTALYLHHLQSQDPTNNPVYNSRLVSSTPDPDKLLAELSSSKLPSNIDQVSHDLGHANAGGTPASATYHINQTETQDIPERDVSGTSSVPPSHNHLRNMAEMVDMYKRIELRKYQQLQEAAMLAELDKLNAKQRENLSQHSSQSVVNGTNQSIPVGHMSNEGQFEMTPRGEGHVSHEVDSEVKDSRQSGGFIGTGSLGFITNDLRANEAGSVVPTNPASSAFKPIPFDASQLSAINSGLQGSLDLGVEGVTMDGVAMDTVGRGSSLTGFQPFMETQGQVMPPQTWISDSQKQLQQAQALQAIRDLDNVYHGNTQGHHSNTQGQGHQGNAQGQQGRGQGQVEPLKLLSDIMESDREAQNTGRTDSTGVSQNTDYAKLPRPVNQGQGQGQPVGREENIELSKHNGLFQIHRVMEQGDNGSNKDSDTSKLGSDCKSNNSAQMIPEKDIPDAGQAIPVSILKGGSKDENGKISTQRDGSQNLSDISTPRNQNCSGAGSTVSQPGRVVFIPSDNSGTQNVIGYLPGVPIVTGVNQPMSWPVTGELPTDGSVLSSVIGPNQGQVTLQTTSGVTPENLSGSQYPSSSQVNKIAAGDIGVRKLRYLIKELKECNKVTKDVEISRLVDDIDTTVNSIPQLSLTFNLYTEIELAMQPLRNENSQLRRKLRLINQQLKDKEEDGNKDINFEKLHLQTSNDTLQKLLKEEKEIKARLAGEVQHVHAELHKMRVERSKMIAEVSEKETLNLKFRQETLLETQKMGHDVQIMKKEQEGLVNKLEALEKENHILQITLQQRDAEIERQHQVVEEMKGSISDLLHELDQSRSGEQGWDHNHSYGLNKLMKIMEEEGSFTQKSSGLTTRQKLTRRRSPERRQFDFNSTADTSGSTARLTREALADHDKKHTVSGARLGPVGRQGPASESELDTLVEMNRRGRDRDVSPKRADGDRFKQPVRRRTSSSSPARFRKSPQGGAEFDRRGVEFDRRGAGFDRNKDYHTALRDRIDNSRHRSGYEMYDRSRDAGKLAQNGGRSTSNERAGGVGSKKGFSRSCESSPASKGIPVPRYSDVSPSYRGQPGPGRAQQGASNRTEISEEQSRYSVTDYFRKYPKSSLDEGQSLSLDDPRSFVPQGHQRSNTERVQPSRNLFRSRPSRPDVPLQTSSEVGDPSSKSGHSVANTNVKQRTLFKGMNYDDTISAIPDDDQMSSVSMSSVTTANTIDDKRFRSGIATLDANIAKLQMALQKTKSMLT